MSVPAAFLCVSDAILSTSGAAVAALVPPSQKYLKSAAPYAKASSLHWNHLATNGEGPDEDTSNATVQNPTARRSIPVNGLVYLPVATAQITSDPVE